MKVAESGKLVLGRCVIDFQDKQVRLRQFSLNLIAYKVMMVFFKIWPGNIKKSQQINEPADTPALNYPHNSLVNSKLGHKYILSTLRLHLSK